MMTPNKKIKAQKILTLIVFCLLISNYGSLIAQTKVIPLEHFDKVIVSPHIQVNFVMGDEESVSIESISVSEDKLNVEVSGSTLRIYLDDAKTVTKSEKSDDHNGKKSIYDRNIVKATVTYKNLKELSLRGEQKFVCESLLELDKFILNVYGESRVILNEVKLNNLNTTIYGESYLEIKSGSIGRHKIIAYGESEVNTPIVTTKVAKITAYGEANIRLMVTDDLKVTSYGEANIAYSGNPKVNKGIVIGDATIKKIN
jgi:hypothetical protein